MDLVDSHCHLDDSQFEPDRAAVFERARAAGLKWLLAIGTGDGPPDLECAVRLADQHDFVLATVGVHPNSAAKATNETFQDLTRLLRHPKVVALGEIGLDYHWDVLKELQAPLFECQLQLAREARKPIIIHTRDAWNDTLAILTREWVPTGLPCLMHCFTGDPAQARQCLDLGFYLAFGGVATFAKSGELRESARIAPSDRLLLETDAPYLAPIPFRGKRNEPAYVAYTARAIAAARNVPVEELAAATTSNFERLFGLGTLRIRQ